MPRSSADLCDHDTAFEVEQPDAAIERLAKLPALDYARERKSAAKDLGCPLGMLDSIVKAARGNVAPLGQGRAIEFPRIEPWDEPVDCGAVLDAVVDSLRLYVVMSAEQTDAAALWTAHSHAHEASDTSPKLVVKSAQKRSGKTRLVEVLSRVTAKPLPISGIRPAALLRLIEMHRPTLLLDEMDALMRQDREMAEALRGLINSGFDRGTARYVMSVPTADGGFEPRAFSTWCPQLLAGIGNLPDTVRDRAIELDMQRKPRGQKVNRLRRRDGRELHEIARKLARLAVDNMIVLRVAQPATPDGLNDRAADAWEPLFAIADLAGADWPRRARRAALALSGDAAIEDEEVGTILLTDIREAFMDRGGDHLPSAELVALLEAMKDRPWADWRGGKGLTPNGLARLLKPYRIAPVTIRVGLGTPKGYRLNQFLDVFERYLSQPPDSIRNSATPVAAVGQSVDSEAPHPDLLLRIENGETSSNGGLCGAVADADLLPGAEEEF